MYMTSLLATPSPYNTNSFFFTDNFLNLTGENPVINRSVAIHEADRGKSCVNVDVDVGGIADNGDSYIAARCNLYQLCRWVGG